MSLLELVRLHSEAHQHCTVLSVARTSSALPANIQRTSTTVKKKEERRSSKQTCWSVHMPQTRFPPPPLTETKWCWCEPPLRIVQSTFSHSWWRIWPAVGRCYCHWELTIGNWFLGSFSCHRTLQIPHSLAKEEKQFTSAANAFLRIHAVAFSGASQFDLSVNRIEALYRQHRRIAASFMFDSEK